MKVKCRKIISPTTKEDLGEQSSWLKRDNEYVVLAFSVSSKFGVEIYIQTEHHNEPAAFSLEGFEILSQTMPSNWIMNSKTLGDETIVTYIPKSWDYKEFFEEIADEMPIALGLFHKEAETIYAEEGIDLA